MNGISSECGAVLKHFWKLPLHPTCNCPAVIFFIWPPVSSRSFYDICWTHNASPRKGELRILFGDSGKQISKVDIFLPNSFLLSFSRQTGRSQSSNVLLATFGVRLLAKKQGIHACFPTWITSESIRMRHGSSNVSSGHLSGLEGLFLGTLMEDCALCNLSVAIVMCYRRLHFRCPLLDSLIMPRDFGHTYLNSILEVIALLIVDNVTFEKF